MNFPSQTIQLDRYQKELLWMEVRRRMSLQSIDPVSKASSFALHIAAIARHIIENDRGNIDWSATCRDNGMSHMRWISSYLGPSTMQIKKGGKLEEIEIYPSLLTDEEWRRLFCWIDNIPKYLLPQLIQKKYNHYKFIGK